MREIPLYTYGDIIVDFAKVDDADYEMLNAFRWNRRFNHCGIAYAATRMVAEDGRAASVQMHRLVLGAKAGELSDHRDGDGLNNQRGNLRIATPQQNSANAVRRGRKNQYKGVARHHGSWCAFIGGKRNRRSLGSFASPETAARAYDDAARITFGEFACVNFPRVGERSAITGEIARGAA